MNRKVLLFFTWVALVIGTISFNALTTKASVPNIVVQFQSQPLFNQANFAPGQTVTRSATVTNNYNTAKQVAVKATNVTDPNGLASQINFVIKQGATVLFNGTLQGLISAGEQQLSNIPNGATVQYDFSATFNPNSGNSFQGKTLSFDFTIGFQGQNQGTVTIVKKTVGGDGSFAYSGSLGAFNLQTTNGTVVRSFSNVNAGTYTITEAATSGWALSSLVCVDPSNNTVISGNAATINLAANETVTCTYTNTKLGTISGMKFNDINRDGQKQNNEPGLKGWIITLRSVGNGIIQTTTTDVNGNYSFTNLPAGNYKVRETHQKGWKRQTKNPKTITISAGSNVATVNFGNAQKKNNEKEDTDTDDLRDDQ